jgi:hypothetical protein
MKNRTFALAFASVIIAGPALASREEATTWAAEVEGGTQKAPLEITAVGQEAFGDGQMPEGVNDLTEDQLDMEAGIEIVAYHGLTDVRQDGDNWFPVIRADIRAAAPLRELDRSITDGIMVASPLFETADEARDWFAGIDNNQVRFVPSAVGATAMGFENEEEASATALLGHDTFFRQGDDIDLDNGITVDYVDGSGYGFALLEELEDQRWVVVFEADIRYAEKLPEPEAATPAAGTSHERGIISSPVLVNEQAAQDWLETLRNGDGEAFVPQLVGRAAVEAFGEDKPELGEFNHLPEDVNWDLPVTVSGVNEHYRTVPVEGGFVAVINADFTYTAKEPVGAAD